jgi:hypothetical protein
MNVQNVTILNLFIIPKKIHGDAANVSRLTGAKN